MARGFFRKTSFNKMVGAYRSQWKRFWMRLFTFGMYGRKGMGWWRDPKRAFYNWWYYRTSISIPRLLGYKPSKLAFFCALLCASAVSIFATPFDVIRAGAKAHKIRKSGKIRSKKKSTGTKRNSDNATRSSDAKAQSVNKTADREPAEKKTASADKRTIPPSKSPSERKATDKTSAKPKATAPAKVAPAAPEKKQMQVKHEELSALYQKENASPAVLAQQEAPKVPDEDAPKSKPLYEADRYIRRLVLAGTDLCDQAAANSLSVGTYMQLAAEPENPKDKNVVALFYQGSKIGYIAQKDALPFAACLKLQREVYGVITDIREEAGKKEIEYETWFSGKR